MKTRAIKHEKQSKTDRFRIEALTPEVPRSVWIIYGVILILSATASPIRLISGVPKIGFVPVMVAALASLSLLFVLKNRAGKVEWILHLGLSAITIGGSLGFFLSAAIAHKSQFVAFGFKWLIVSIVLHYFFVQFVRLRNSLPGCSNQLRSPVEVHKDRLGLQTDEELKKWFDDLSENKKDEILREFTHELEKLQSETQKLITEADSKFAKTKLLLWSSISILVLLGLAVLIIKR